jgi:hypothetical protein
MDRRTRYAWLGAAVLVLLVLGGANAVTVPTWSEEIANLPLRPAGVVDLQSSPVARAFPERLACADPHALLDFAPARRVRPALALCLGGRAWPVFATSYASSVFGWPIAAFYPLLGHSVVRLRVPWLLLSGGASLGLAFLLARRLAGERRALLATALAASSSSTVFLGTLFFPYETFVWIGTALGCCTLAPVLADERPATTQRAAAAGLCFGLAVLTNVKALFLLVPLAVWAVRELPVARRLGWRWAVVVACALPPASLLVWFARVDPHSGLAIETSSRVGWAMDVARLAGIVREVVNAGTFGGDTGSFIAATATGAVERGGIAVYVVAAAVATCMVTAAVRLVARRGSPLSTACGLLIGSFVVVSALLYRQGIPANYSPIYPVFGVAVASAIFDAMDALARLRDVFARRSVVVEAAVVVAAMALLGTRAASRIGAQILLPTPMNLVALEEAAAVAAERPDATVVTVVEVQALTLDSLSDERVHTVQANAYFEECARDADPAACVHGRWRALLSRVRCAFQVLAPTHDRHDAERVYAAELVPALRSEALAAGRTVRAVRDFRVGGAVTMSLYLVEPAGA